MTLFISYNMKGEILENVLQFFKIYKTIQKFGVGKFLQRDFLCSGRGWKNAIKQ